MKKLYVAVLVLSMVGNLAAQQIKILEPANPSVDVNGETIVVSDVPSAPDMEIDLFVVNTSGSTLTMTCTRTEVDGLSGTQNSTCWQVCPETLNTGAKPVYTVNISGTSLEETANDGDTITSFAGHYYPQGLDGCSLFKYEWTDATSGIVYGEVYVRFVHMTSGTCTASVNDHANVDFNVYPNPVDQDMQIKLSDSYNNDINVKIVDILGKVVSSVKVPAGSIYTSISTTELVEGIYFVNFSANDKVLLTKKIVVRH